MRCFRCGTDVEVASKLGRTDGCPRCRSDLKVCLNCRLYDRGAQNECRESAAEPVPDKDKANFCEYFEPGEGHGVQRGTTGQQDKARAAFDALFRKN